MDADVVREIDRLLDDHTCDEIAAQLNARGWRSFEGKVFHAQRIVRLRRDYGLRDRYSRLRAAGLERTFAWLGRYRRVSKDDEAQTESSATMVYLAMIQIMLRRRPARA